MENVTDALKIAAAVMVFVIALTLTFSMISKAKQTSDVIFQIEDDSKYFQEGLEGVTYLTAGENEKIVGWDTVVSSIYRYNIERYGVTIIDPINYSNSNMIRARFDYETETIVQNWKYNEKTYGDPDSNPNDKLVNKLKNQVLTEYNINIDKDHYYEDVFKRIYQSSSLSTGNTNAPWLSGNEELKERLRVDLQNEQETITFATDGTTYRGLGLAEEYANKRFKEKINVITDTQENGDVSEYIEIIYEVQ